MTTITDRASYTKATSASSLSVLEATASWCPQCKAIEPVLQNLIKQFPDASFYKYDVDASPGIAHELGVRQMPSFHLFREGDLLDSITGAKAKELEKMIGENYGRTEG